MPRKKNIFVVMGGKSPEHEISLLSGREVVGNLNNSKYKVFPILISKDGERWQLTTRKSLYNVKNPIEHKGTSIEIILSEKSVFNGIKSVPDKPDIVFISMHGPFGEDGTIQGMLDMAGIKYTGSGVLASALGMDKLMFKNIMHEKNILVPKYIQISKGESMMNIIKTLGNLPYFVKPSNQGSSVGTAIVKNKRSLKKALNNAWRYSKYALVEEYIKGTEVTCAILGNDKPIALPLVEIIPNKAEYFDYDSKYSESGSDEIVPARISKNMTEIIKKTAINVHKSLGCKGFSRVDFIIKNDEVPVVLEINTIPGLTPMSLLPKAAAKSGLSYPQLLDKIIDNAFE